MDVKANRVCSIPGCGRRHSSKGLCFLHYIRQRRHGVPEFAKGSHNASERFAASIDRSGGNGCWLWTGNLFKDGYGKMSENGKHVRAHRYSYQTYHGPIPTGTSVLHKCDVRDCVNPAHLFLGTHRENMADMTAKNRSPFGGKNPMAKLTAENVAEIRRRYAAGGISQRALGAEFSVGDMAISLIVNGKRWSKLYTPAKPV